MSNLYPFEVRIIEAEELGIDVYERKFESSMKGLYMDNVIVIDKRLSWKDKNCILAEEIGHTLFNFGDITDQNILSNRKQERQGRVYAYQCLASLDDLILSCKYCSNIY